jgi:hypothetical protein
MVCSIGADKHSRCCPTESHVPDAPTCSKDRDAPKMESRNSPTSIAKG